MVKVTIRRLRAGLTGASGLMLLQQAGVGCAAPAPHEATSSTTSADTVDPVGAGTGTLTPMPYWTPSGTPHYSVAATGSIDEFVRVGESLTFSISAYQLWAALKPTAAIPEIDVLEKLEATFQVAFVSKGDVVGRATPKVGTWTGDAYWDLTGATEAFTVPAGTDTLEIGLVVVDPSDGTRVELADLDFDTVPVFGGELPNKHALFDNAGSTLRQRVIEGGGLVPGGDVILTYTDWRADEMVDKTNLDRTIGSAQSYSRFGPVTIPIYGEVQYEVSAGYSYVPEWGFAIYPMTATKTSRVINQAGRTGYETTLYVPQNGEAILQLFFHVKAYLVADYTSWGSSVLTKRYNQGDRILLKDVYDNKDGKAFENYDVPVEAQATAP
jgi:hypothetical protein